jgi:hypothetical protein
MPHGRGRSFRAMAQKRTTHDSGVAAVQKMQRFNRERMPERVAAGLRHRDGRGAQKGATGDSTR